MASRSAAQMLAHLEAHSVELPNGCIVWQRRISDDGYGHAFWNGRNRLTHRIAYELSVGPIPDGLQLDHKCHSEDDACSGGVSCRHRACLNILHLEPVTPKINTGRGVSARKTHCLRGHLYDEANTRYSSDGHRFCRACNREAAAQSKIRRAMRAANVRLDGAA